MRKRKSEWEKSETKREEKCETKRGEKCETKMCELWFTRKKIILSPFHDSLLWVLTFPGFVTSSFSSSLCLFFSFPVFGECELHFKCQKNLFTHKGHFRYLSQSHGFLLNGNLLLNLIQLLETDLKKVNTLVMGWRN